KRRPLRRDPTRAGRRFSLADPSDPRSSSFPFYHSGVARAVKPVTSGAGGTAHRRPAGWTPARDRRHRSRQRGQLQRTVEPTSACGRGSMGPFGRVHLMPAAADPPASTLWTEAAHPIAVAAVAHGAGADMRHPFMTGIAEGLAAGGLSVLRFNFSYIDGGRRMPDPPPVLLDTWDRIIQEAAHRARGPPLGALRQSLAGP